MKPCLLPDSDRARFVNLAGAATGKIVAEEVSGRMSPETGRALTAAFMILAEIVGIPGSDVKGAAISLALSKDRKKWVENMVGTS